MTDFEKRVQELVANSRKTEMVISFSVPLVVLIWVCLIREWAKAKTNQSSVVLRRLADQLRAGIVTVEPAYGELLREDSVELYAAPTCHECEPAVETPHAAYRCPHCGA